MMKNSSQNEPDFQHDHLLKNIDRDLFKKELWSQGLFPERIVHELAREQAHPVEVAAGHPHRDHVSGLADHLRDRQPVPP